MRLGSHSDDATAAEGGDRAIRAAGALSRGSLGCWGISWPALGRTELVAFDVRDPSDSELTVELHWSAVSPGTERARHVGLPNALVEFPHRPGYAASGVVIEAGASARADGFEPGAMVALLDVPHQSIATVPTDRAKVVPGGVALADAAALQLGVIAGQGVYRAAISRGEPFAVVGSGLVGALAQRIARANGAGPSTVIAASSAKARVASAGGAQRFVSLESEEQAAALNALDLPVVIEASGHPGGLAIAVAAAGRGGRVVVLGSPRSTALRFPLEDIQRKALTVMGAHVTWLRSVAGSSVPDLAAEFLAHLDQGLLNVDDLFVEMDPLEAALAYRRLVTERRLVSIRFDWEQHARRGKDTLEAVRARANGPHLLNGNGNPNGKPGLKGTKPSGEASAQRVGRLLPTLDPTLGAGGSPQANGVLGGLRGFELEPQAEPFFGALGDLRIGIIGCGEIATYNAEAIGQAPNARLVGCFDRHPELAKDLALRHDARVADSAEALLDRGDVDAVLLCLPHEEHAPAAVQALAAGKHVIVEKPLGIDLAAAYRIARAAEASGRLLSVCLPQRYDPSVAAARDFIRAGAIGTLTHVELRWLADKPLSYWYTGFSGRSTSTWRTRPDGAGGGVLIMNLCHGIDLVRHLTGVEVDAVTAFTGSADGFEVEDSVAASIRFGNGAVGSLTGGASARGSRADGLTVWGTDGHVELTMGGGSLFSLHALDGRVPPVRAPLPTGSTLLSRAVFMSRFATSVEKGMEPEVTADDGLRVQAVIEAAYRSTRSGRVVRPADLLEEVRQGGGGSR